MPNDQRAVLRRGPDWREEWVDEKTRTLVVQAGMNYRADPINAPDHWEQCRPALEDDPDSPTKLRSIHQRMPVRFPRVASGPVGLRLPGRGVVSIRPHGANLAPVTWTEGAATYVEAWDQTDLILEPWQRGYKETLLLTGPGHPEEYSFTVRGGIGQKLKLVQEEDGRVWVVDEDGIWVEGEDSGKRYMCFRAPFILTLDNPREPIRYGSLSLDGSTVTVHLPDLTGLSYPIKVDPSAEYTPMGAPQDAEIFGESWQEYGQYDLQETWDRAHEGLDWVSVIQSSFMFCGVTSLYDEAEEEDFGWKIHRDIFVMNTTALLSSWDIISAKLELYVYGEPYTQIQSGNTRIDIFETHPGNYSLLTLADYDDFFTTVLNTGTHLVSAMDGGQYHEWTFNQDGLDAINPEAHTALGARCGWDIDDDMPTADPETKAGVFLAQKEWTSDPTLTVTYTAPESYTGAGLGTLAPIQGTAAGSYASPGYHGAGVGILAALIGVGAGSMVAPVYHGAGVGELAPIEGISTGTYGVAFYSGAGVGSLAPLTSVGAGSTAGAAYHGAGAGDLAPIEGEGAGSYAYPAGAGVGELAPLTSVGEGSYALPVFQPQFITVAEGDANEVRTFGNLPSGTKITVRALESAPGRIRSPYSGEEDVTLDSLTPPNTLVVGAISGDRATGTWINGEASYSIEVLLNGDRVIILDAGSTTFTLTGLAVSTNYNSPGMGVRHIDRFGGVSATDEDDFTTGAVASTLTKPYATRILVGGPLA